MHIFGEFDRVFCLSQRGSDCCQFYPAKTFDFTQPDFDAFDRADGRPDNPFRAVTNFSFIAFEEFGKMASGRFVIRIKSGHRQKHIRIQ
ncbi:hypothetical protein ASE67_10780 [Sphingomonas sp. Leaf23]|nr:hypothetical protein ASE67_10780 [Sphingomonas sp. Leaf23]